MLMFLMFTLQPSLPPNLQTPPIRLPSWPLHLHFQLASEIHQDGNRTPGSPFPTDCLLVSLTHSVSPSLNMGGAHIDSRSLAYHVQASQQIPQPSLLSSTVTNLVQVTTASCWDYFNTLNWPPSSISSPPSNHSDIKTHQKHKMARVTSHGKHFNSIYSVLV